ncbi:MAG: acyl carrier protein [Gallicola sp.]|nr:acyl carrier protein [Gallicola sp.]
MTFDKVKDIIVENLGCDESEVTMEASLMDDLGADSLDAVELSLALEDELGVKIPDEDFEKMTTVKDIVNYIDQQ